MRNFKQLQDMKSFTDFVLNGQYTNVGGLWNTIPLMDPPSWTAVFRQTPGTEDQGAIIRNMHLEWYAQPGLKRNTVHFSIFIVTLRPGAVNFVPIPTSMTPVNAYVEMGEGNPVQLNPGIFKVHYHQHVEVEPRTDGTGNQYFKNSARGEVNMTLNYRSRPQLDLPWKNRGINYFPPHQRLWCLVYVTCPDDTNPDRSAEFSLGSKFTAVNAI